MHIAFPETWKRRRALSVGEVVSERRVVGAGVCEVGEPVLRTISGRMREVSASLSVTCGEDISRQCVSYALPRF